MNIYTFLKATKAAILLVLLSSLNLRSADENMVLPYDEPMVSTENSAPTEQTYAGTSESTQPELAAETTLANNQNPFAEIDLDPNALRAAKTSHRNLVIALTQPEQRDSNNQMSGGDTNSGAMRDVEKNVLESMVQNIGDPDDTSKIVFIRLDVTRNAWIWDYFNDGTSAQSIDRNNGTPQYLFFNNGNLTSILVGNRDDSAFRNWIQNNITIERSESEPEPTAPEPEFSPIPEEQITQPETPIEEPTGIEEQSYSEEDLAAEIQ